MNGSTQLIAIIAALIVTAGGVVILYEVSQNYQAGTKTVAKQQTTDTKKSEDLVLVNIVGTNVSNDGVKYVHFQVRYDGEGTLNLNDTLIQLRTGTSITDLHYRNGTTVRDSASGFYTQ